MAPLRVQLKIDYKSLNICGPESAVNLSRPVAWSSGLTCPTITIVWTRRGQIVQE